MDSDQQQEKLYAEMKDYCEDSRAFRDFERHVLKFETITTEQEKQSLMERFLVLDSFFHKLVKASKAPNSYSAQELVEQFGGNYEEIMARALIAEEWKSALEMVHDSCVLNLEMPLLTKAMPYNRDNQKLFDQCIDEQARWSRIKNGEETPRIPLRITLERMP